ncbi:MAG: type II toxin-antitoxin system VapC family toxin [Phycisphaerales bacterium]|nr:MAG: type II toxin-antitoxin system VapC family toxin [Phycisphaerales bacterium]
MTTCFADTYFFLALLSADDEAHNRAVESNRSHRGAMVTTAWVLTEVADALAAPTFKPVFLELVDALRSDPQVTIVPPSQALFDRGLGLFSNRLDKSWSLTDCISFVVMEDRGIVQALTGDHHFEQAGFRAILRG